VEGASALPESLQCFLFREFGDLEQLLAGTPPAAEGHAGGRDPEGFREGVPRLLGGPAFLGDRTDP
jgi:hypothetical protein